MFNRIEVFLKKKIFYKMVFSEILYQITELVYALRSIVEARVEILF